MHRNPPLQDLSIYHRRGHGNHHSISYSQGLAILIGTYNHLPLHSILRFGHILCSVLWLVHGTVSSVYRSYPSISNRIHLSNPGSIRIPPGRCSQSLKHIHRNLHLTDHDILYIFHHTYRGTLYTHYLTSQCHTSIFQRRSNGNWGHKNYSQSQKFPCILNNSHGNLRCRSCSHRQSNILHIYIHRAYVKSFQRIERSLQVKVHYSRHMNHICYHKVLHNMCNYRLSNTSHKLNFQTHPKSHSQCTIYNY